MAAAEPAAKRLCRQQQLDMPAQSRQGGFDARHFGWVMRVENPTGFLFIQIHQPRPFENADAGPAIMKSTGNLR